MDDDINRLTSLTDGSSMTPTAYDYDAMNRLEEIASANGTVNYTYDDASRRETMVVAGTGTYTYGYDNADRLTSV